MELNKIKYREYLVNILNFVYDTKSFISNNDSKTKNLFHISSETLSTVVHVVFNVSETNTDALIIV